MKAVVNKRQIELYLWLTLGYMAIWILFDMHSYPEEFWPRLWDNAWRAPYLLVVNFIFFEYSVPFILRKRRYLIYNILLAILVLWVHMMLWSFGLYAWRGLGIALG